MTRLAATLAFLLLAQAAHALGEVHVRWLGVAGFTIGPESSAPELPHTSVYLVGHSHYDHLGDVAWLAARSGGRVVGSATTAAIARGYGLAEDRAVIAGPGETFDAGDFEVRVFASEHAKALAGRVPFPGEVTEPPDAPIHAFSFKLGDARGYLVTERSSGLRVVLLSTAIGTSQRSRSSAAPSLPWTCCSRRHTPALTTTRATSCARCGRAS